MSRVPTELGPFTKGVNLVDPLVKLNGDELSYCLNYRLGERGDFYKRPGHDNYGSSPAKVNGDNIVNFIARYYKSDGSKLLLAAAGGKFRKGNDSTGAWTDISIDGSGASMNSSNLCDFIVYKDRIYIIDGTHPHRYNGTDDRYAGHYSHAAPTLTDGVVGGGGLVAGKTYKYAVANIQGSLGVGPIGAVATKTVGGGNNKIDISNLRDMTDATGVAHESTGKRIYRTMGDGTEFFFLIDVTAAATTYTDVIADSNLGDPYTPVHAPQTDSRFAIVGHDERTYWWGRGGVNASVVEVSDVGFPDRIEDTSSFTVANNDSDILTGGGLVPGGIIFFKKNSMWLLRAFGFGLVNIQPKDKRSAGVGTTSPFSVVNTPIGLIFLSQRREVYLFDGTNIREIGKKIASQFKAMSQSSIERIVACYHDYRYIISYDYRSAKGYNWRTLEYDTIYDKWEGPHENGDLYNPSYYSVWDSVLDKGELYWGEAKSGSGSYVYGRGEFSKTDRGTRFISTGRTGAIAMAGLGEVKSIKAFVHGDFSADASMTLTHIDELGVRTQKQLQAPLTYNGAIYNKSKYNDGSKYAGVSTQVLEGSLDIEARSRVPIYELSDGGTATESHINLVRLLVDPLPLK